MECREEGNKLLGPGVYDMKSGLISAIWMIRVYKELGIVPDKKLVILCNGDEETGSRESTEIICREAKLAKAALVVEPCCDNGDLKTGRKGFVQFRVTIRGKAAHSGNAHQDGANAIEEMAHEILFAQGLTDYEAGTTVNVGVAGGGTKCNVVPDQAAFWIECRFKTVSQQQKVIDAICNLEVKVAGTSRQVEVLDNRMPMEEEEGNLKLFEIARRCGEKIGLSFSRQFVGGFSDGNAISAMGIPVLDGLGAVGGHAHSPEEYILIDQFIPRIALLATLVLNI